MMHRIRDSFLVLACVLASLLVPRIASANTAAGAENHVWAFDLAGQVGVEVERSLTLELHRGCAPTNDELGSGSLLAAKGGKWTLGTGKSATKWERQLAKRGWTPDQITEALQKGKQFRAENLVNRGNSATRYVHPETGRSVVIDDVTREVLHVGGDGFKY